ncbi:GNAT family N-acetyltransferase [Levilactobacillus suantsaiihabitans]|jgi:predicted N-acetyltransferase YhbS|uniref:GNAT family N-acetyltransferase n=1 Tax=Levilactobacillus suantsaiihabitans TaxID=2487722 RepID=A0A4Z0JD42_9LACO|nr:GNAT family N-acetyltransferase [Levilactobacillus suantsaiihabitans]
MLEGQIGSDGLGNPSADKEAASLINKFDIRAMRYEDVPALANIVGRLWRFDRTDDQRNNLAAQVYFRRCMTQQNYVRVAVWDHQVVGAILADTKYQKKERSYDVWQLLVAKAALAVRPGGWQLLKQLNERSEIDERLLANLQRREFLGEIVLLMVDPEYQNLGIGRELMHTVATYWDAAPVDKVYLFTAVAGTDRFYRQHGFRESTHEQIDWQTAHQQRRLSGYLYTGHVHDLATDTAHHLLVD